ncbi:hypothetical protein [Pseudomonas brassicacearum]|uniref:hypothetical protein n=1 Tax=Pseudomonas brassicacearum TaxID=930166 RepID=UPI0011CE0B76|nr:hypothetical protein [Pseudomonas brassicacearum]
MEKYIELVVDGQLVIAPSVSEWEGILNTGKYQDGTIFNSNLEVIVRNMLDFLSGREDEFCLGLHLTKSLKPWVPIHLYRMDERWQRVLIERVTCDQCNWVGKIANPSDPTLYFGVDGELGVAYKALSLPRCNCPKCGMALPRIAVWVEDIETGQE